MDFWPLLGVYPPGLALADYWSHLLGVYPPWPGVYPLALLWVYPFDWVKPGVYPPNHTGFTPKWAPPTFPYASREAATQNPNPGHLKH